MVMRTGVEVSLMDNKVVWDAPWKLSIFWEVCDNWKRKQRQTISSKRGCVLVMAGEDFWMRVVRDAHAKDSKQLCHSGVSLWIHACRDGWAFNIKLAEEACHSLRDNLKALSKIKGGWADDSYGGGVIQCVCVRINVCDWKRCVHLSRPFWLHLLKNKKLYNI